MLVAASTGLATQARFETRVDLVAMEVCATDHSGHPAQIGSADLVVFDNGVRQRLALFLPGDRVPLAITLLIDSSQSMGRGLLTQATAAASALIRELPGDSLIEVMSFNDHTAVLYPIGIDHREAALALTESSPTGRSAHYQ